MKSWILVLAGGLLALASCGSGSESKSASWYTFNEGLKKAVKEKKPMMVDVYADWCQPCKLLDKNTFQNPGIKKIFDKSFVTVKLNAENQKEKISFEGKNYEAMDFAGHLGIEGYPTMLFFDKDGRYVNAVVGYVPPEEFEKVLDFFLKEKYKTGETLQKILGGS